MSRNDIKDKLARGETTFGTWSMIPSPMVANVLARSGADFVIIDLEHGPASLDTLESIVYAVEAGGAEPIVRVPRSTSEDILRVLEVGVDSIMMSHVGEPEDAKALVSDCMYPPDGSRGLSPFTRVHDYAEDRLAEKMMETNTSLLVGALVEGDAGIANLEAIASTPGLDLVYFGIYDMASTMGIPGDLDNPRLVEVLKRCVSIVESAGKAAGTVARDVKSLEVYAGLGFRFLAYRNDTSMLMEAARVGVTAFNGLSVRK